MYAVIKTGGKQYRVATGEKIKVEQIAAEVGQEIVIDQVLAVGNGSDLKIGTPLVAGAAVTVTVVSHGRGEKVRIFKMRRRKHYQKRQGHRQHLARVKGVGLQQVLNQVCLRAVVPVVFETLNQLRSQLLRLRAIDMMCLDGGGELRERRPLVRADLRRYDRT